MLNVQDELDRLSPKEKEEALKILKEYAETGKSETMDKFLYEDYAEIPVDIHTFLHEEQYLGAALYDKEGRFTLYPFWEETLKKIFPTNIDTDYHTVVLTGGIGIGKAQPLSSLVLTESGFKKMGDLTLNDKVYGNDGELHNVLGIFP